MIKLCKKNTIICQLLMIIVLGTFFSSCVSAESDISEHQFATGFSMSPMYEKIALNPGDSYTSSFEIFLPNGSTKDFHYSIYTQSYYRDENNSAIFENVNNMGDIAQWITIDSPTEGILKPNNSTKIYFTINVPENAPAGGQYAAITVGSFNSTPNNEDEEDKAIIQESVAIAYTIYAEITGNTIRQGEIIDVDVPSFILSDNIVGYSSIKNTGNIHGGAEYKLQVYPLFSDEEIYTNEEQPQTKLIMPNRTLYNETVWENTPAVGIFNVIYTVEFEGVTAQVSKMVIKCPIWLLFLIIFAVIALIIYFIVKAKSRSHKHNKAIE